MLPQFLLVLALLELGVSPLVVLGQQPPQPDNGDQSTCDVARLKQEIDIVKNVTITAFKYLLLKLPPLEKMVSSLANEQAEIKAKLDTIVDLHMDGLTQYTSAVSCHHISPRLPSGYFWVRSSDGTAVQVYCDTDRQCTCSAVTGGWARVAYLNMTDPTHHCPTPWREITRIEDPMRLCRNPSSGCSSVVFDAYGLSYNRVCGRIYGYQYRSPDAFRPYGSSDTIDDVYVDGVTITHGMNPRKHVWTFAAALAEGLSHSGSNCPCTNINNPRPANIPPWVGEDYFCETGNPFNNWDYISFYPDKLWDGQNCGTSSTCCELHNPPWFCKQLPESTNNDIEVRICKDEGTENEDISIELIEIYVQ